MTSLLGLVTGTTECTPDHTQARNFQPESSKKPGVNLLFKGQRWLFFLFNINKNPEETKTNNEPILLTDCNEGTCHPVQKYGFVKCFFKQFFDNKRALGTEE